MMLSVKHIARLCSLLSMTGVCFYGCIEPFNAELSDFESVLVVEATITNEMKRQQVFLTRTFEFDTDGPAAESNADVRVITGGVTLDFEETDPGVYVSTQAFAAQPNTTYQLQIATENGRLYSSDETMLTTTTQIDEVRAERIINDDGVDGIAILVDSFDPTANSVNYRYTYEETYRIIAPDWTPIDMVEDQSVPCGVAKAPKENQERICYATDFSNEIILTNTSKLQEDRVSNFPVRFVNRNNYIISHRYSILVRQLVQSNTAFAFYETLEQFSGGQSLFAEIQPGFLEGNVFSVQNQDEKVLGFFDVASVTERRIFFNYTDFYPNEPLPPYVDLCAETALPLANEDGSCFLQAVLELNTIRFVRDNNNPTIRQGPFFTVPRVCGDCTVLGGTEVPEFWIE